MAATYEQREPTARSTRPVLVVALEGWIDAGMARQRGCLDPAERARHRDRRHVRRRRAARPPRPTPHHAPRRRRVTTADLAQHRAAGGPGPRRPRPAAPAPAPSPTTRWRAFGHAVVDLAAEFGVRAWSSGLGAYPATVPHTRPIRLSITAGTEELAGRWPLPPGQPRRARRRPGRRRARSPPTGAWRPRPVGPDPPLRRRRRLPRRQRGPAREPGAVAGLRLPRGELVEEAAETDERLDAAIARNDEHTAMLRALEADADDAPVRGRDPLR